MLAVGFGRLQMVLESDIGRCVSENVGSQRRWIVRSHIGWKKEQNIFYKEYGDGWMKVSY